MPRSLTTSRDISKLSRITRKIALPLQGTRSLAWVGRCRGSREKMMTSSKIWGKLILLWIKKNKHRICRKNKERKYDFPIWLLSTHCFIIVTSSSRILQERSSTLSLSSLSNSDLSFFSRDRLTTCGLRRSLLCTSVPAILIVWDWLWPRIKSQRTRSAFIKLLKC